MNHKFDLQQSIGLLLIVALILGAVTLLVMREGNTEAIQLPSLKPINSSKEPVVDLAGQERTVEISLAGDGRLLRKAWLAHA
jgi:hypothetical protein